MSKSRLRSRAQASYVTGALRAPLLACALVLLTGCAPTLTSRSESHARACPASNAACAPSAVEGRVEVTDPLLGERIEHLAGRSASFKRAWDMIRGSGVPVTVGTATQLRRHLPSSFRKNPSTWAGVTVVRSSPSGDAPSRAFVALQMRMLQEMADGLPSGGQAYLLGEIDRVLIHEIYGHLAPMFSFQGPAGECLDVARPGEARPCVEVREEHVANEVAASVAAGSSRP